MTTVISQAAATAEGTALSALVNSGFLKIYTGSRPASPETGASGTLLVTLPLAATAMTWSNGVGTLGGVPLTGYAVAAGTPGWARFSTSGGTGTIDVDVGVGSTTLWAASTPFTPVGEVVTNPNNNNTYILTTAGTSTTGTGPSGTGSGITDGTCVWNYLGAKTTDGINLAVASVVAGLQVSLSAYTFTIPSV